jgi:hypothetical protein
LPPGLFSHYTYTINYSYLFIKFILIYFLLSFASNCVNERQDNRILDGGVLMKTCRFLVFLALAIGLLAGPGQVPAQAEMLGRPAQIRSLYYSGGSWYENAPNGTQPPFILAAEQSFIMTEIRARFYVTNTATDTGPYRFYLMGPNATRLYIANLTDAMYPGSATVWGGVISETSLDPGYVFTTLPTPQVQQLPQPPANPNSGPIRSGTFYLTVRGYVVP